MNQFSLQDTNQNISPRGADWGSQNLWTWEGFSCHWRMIGNPLDQPIVLIHGFGASSSHWRHNAKDFAESGFCVYGLDLIGFGQSEQPSTKKIRSLDNEFWAKQLVSFLETIVLTNKFSKAILVGNSLGGLVAITAIARREDLIRTVIASPLPDPALVRKPGKFQSKIISIIKTALVKIFFRLLPLEIIVPLIARTKLIKIFLGFAYSRNISSDRELEKIIRDPAKKSTAARALRAMCIGMTLRPTYSTAPELLKRLTKKSQKPKILLIWGREDKLVPLSIGKNLLEEHPWLKLLIVDNSGHCPHDESPNYFNQSVLNWLEFNLKANS